MNQDLIVFILEIICLKKKKDEAYVINFDEYADVGTHCIALFCIKSEIVYFDSFGVEQKLKHLLEIKTSKQTFFEYNQTIQ